MLGTFTVVRNDVIGKRLVLDPFSRLAGRDRLMLGSFPAV